MKSAFAFALVMTALLGGGCASHHGDHKHKMHAHKDCCKGGDCCKEAGCCQEAPVGTTLPAK